jgi:hypothetical protein
MRVATETGAIFDNSFGSGNKYTAMGASDHGLGLVDRLVVSRQSGSSRFKQEENQASQCGE